MGKNNPKILPHQLNNQTEFTPYRRC